MENQNKKIHKESQKFLLAVFNDRNHRRVVNFKFRKGSAIAALVVFVIAVFAGVWSLIAYTSLRERIPGYPSEELRNDIVRNALVADSLKLAIQQWELYLVNIQRIISGEEPFTPQEMQAASHSGGASLLPLMEGRSQADSLLREQVKEQERFAVSSHGRSSEQSLEEILFFPPIKGIISEGFDASQEHFAVDIAAPANTVISAVLDGTVILATWTDATGFVMQIQHSNNLVSVYKHCASLFYKAGDTVLAGQAIAIVGNTGLLSSGNHLHFELWQKGVALDPAKYIKFE